MLKKNIANRPEATRNITELATESERTRKIDSRTSGATARRSSRTNTVSKTKATAKRPSVVDDVQPSVSVLTIAYTSVINPPVAVTAPPMS